jgi:hypothetical protein
MRATEVLSTSTTPESGPAAPFGGSVLGCPERVIGATEDRRPGRAPGCVLQLQMMTIAALAGRTKPWDGVVASVKPA